MKQGFNKKSMVFVIGIIVILAIMSYSLVSAAVVFSDDFNDGNATGWTVQYGTWSVVSDSGSYVYYKSGTDEGRSSAGSQSWTNCSVQARVKVDNFNGSNRAYVCGRYKDGNNYYAASLMSNTIEIRKKVSGSSSTLVSKSYTVATGTWYTVKLELNRSTINMYINGSLQLTTTDSSLTSGAVGLVPYKVTAKYDDVIVDDTGGSTPTPTVRPGSTPTPTRIGTPTPTTRIAPTVTRINTPTPTRGGGSYPAIGSPVGWASVNALNQNGTTGGAGGTVIDVYTKAELDAAAYKDDNPAIIVIHGTLTGGPAMDTNVKSNKTIVGAGSGAYLNFGLYLRGSNIIIKNLDVMNGGFNPGDSEGLDTVTFAQDLHHIWVDHCTMHETQDGLVDPTRNARFVTISYCYFHTQKTAILIGGSDDDSAAKSAQSNSDKRNWHYTVTVHHNYWSGVYERAPRVRFGAVHVFNNYFDGNPNYAIGRGDRANIYSENNYFYNTHEAFAAYDDSSNPGYVEDVGSLFEGDNGNTTDNPPSGTYVWTPGQYYSYTAHTAAWVKANLKNYCGVGKGNP